MTGAIGTTKDVTTTVTPEGTSQAVTATSSDDAIATVIQNDVGGFTITLVAAGTASINFTADGHDDIKAALAITVSAVS
ncbi:Ig-like domain-containing protein [Loigolactobacillus zhaoyuanensis]|uniref:Ig-like domain-containing protein n=1 Tax=Loigolactobacillus zhaoyuanensis TaxID=2486017 RepID=UPI0021F078E9|nr:Ig-like domain-containing protein [Loigolactobacillus zhaoyuanensis]